MTFLEQVALATDAEFQSRIQQGAITAAVAILADQPANTPQAIAKHAQRAKLAHDVLRVPSNFARPIASAVVTNGAVSAASTDSDLQWTINSMWDALAGVILEPDAA